ncbi:MAG: AraC family transcriptional regulator [Muribaculaceae bacterium]|nr:AraC family transcriptional regulator [Muribaculaceae bacterium]
MSSPNTTYALTIPKEQLIKDVERHGILIVREAFSFFNINEDYVFSHIIITLCLSGSARAMYDMRVIEHHKNDLAFIMPGHILHPLDCTDDFSYAVFFISPRMFDDLRFHTFSHDFEKFHYAPHCSLTDEQAAHLLAIVDQLIVIASRTDEEMPHRYHTLLAQLAVGYEFLTCYRCEQDKQWMSKRHAEIFSRFCDLVVNNYRESREVKYYADLLNLTPKYLSKVISSATDGLTPAKWIEQYVTAQAKRLIEAHATPTLQETAYMLGFSEPTSFYRYFKRATGMTAKEYRQQQLLHNQMP